METPGMTTEQVKNHIDGLIAHYEKFKGNERDLKNTHAPKIRTSSISKYICNTASIRIKAYDDFVGHLKGLTYLIESSKAEKP